MTVTESATARARKAPADRKRKPADRAPFDVEAAAEAAAREANQEPFTFALRGELFSLPSPTEWEIEVSTVIAGNDLSGAMEILLEDDWPRFKACKPKLGEVRQIFNGMAEHFGVELPGN